MKTVVIERTAKEYKFGMLIGMALIVLGILGLAYSVHVFTQEAGHVPTGFATLAEDQKSVYVSMAGIVVGSIIFLLEKFLAWWNNG